MKKLITAVFFGLLFLSTSLFAANIVVDPDALSQDADATFELNYHLNMGLKDGNDVRTILGVDVDYGRVIVTAPDGTDVLGHMLNVLNSLLKKIEQYADVPIAGPNDSYGLFFNGGPLGINLTLKVSSGASVVCRLKQDAILTRSEEIILPNSNYCK